jgi:hypothetical protein
LSRQTLNFAAGIIRRRRIPGRLAVAEAEPPAAGPPGPGLPARETFAGLAAGFRVGTATAWRHVEETVALLAARAPRLRKAARDAARVGHAYVVLDGTLIPHRPGRRGPALLLLQAQQARHEPAGHRRPSRRHPLVSGALPGSVHDKKAEWMRGVLAELEAAGLVTLADKGYQGSTYAKIPYKGENKPDSRKRRRGGLKRAFSILVMLRVAAVRGWPWRADRRHLDLPRHHASPVARGHEGRQSWPPVRSASSSA